MELQIAGINTELNTEAKQYIEKKLNKLGKHLPDIIDIKVEVSEEKTKSPLQRYLVRATVNSGVGRSFFHSEERAEDLFKAVDKVTDILTRQLEKQKGKLYDRGRGNSQVRGKFVQPAAAESAKKVVKVKHFVIEPMSREEAITEMERLGHSFFLFLDTNANELRLLYRRKDGNYGIIEPEIEQ
jgi:ribosome hibernation promoting factor